MRLMVKEKKKVEEREENIAKFLMKMGSLENFDAMYIYTVEIPAKVQNNLEVKEAKNKEVENLMKYDVFEEASDCGQDCITSRQAVAKGFQEVEALQSDLPTLLRESFKQIKDLD